MQPNAFIVSATFQLMSAGVQIAVLLGESRRGAQQYPLLLGFTVRLYRELVQSLNVAVQSNADAYDLQRENLCCVLQKTMELMAKAEHELMRARIMRVLKGCELRKV